MSFVNRGFVLGVRAAVRGIFEEGVGTPHDTLGIENLVGFVYGCDFPGDISDGRRSPGWIRNEAPLRILIPRLPGLLAQLLPVLLEGCGPFRS